MSYPGPWEYIESDFIIWRELDEDMVEVWCEFSEPPVPVKLGELLNWLNGDDA